MNVCIDLSFLLTFTNFAIITSLNYRSWSIAATYGRIVLNRAVAPPRSNGWHFHIRQHIMMSLSTTTTCNKADDETMNNNDNNTMTSLRVLALHGSEGNGQEFAQSLQQAIPHNHLQIHAPDAPFIKGKGFCWWKLPPGERSYTAATYPGFDTSLHLVVEQMDRIQPHLVMAHSQGAIFMAALLALQYTTNETTVAPQSQLLQRLRPQHSPSVGYILNGLAWPNPFAPQFLQLVQDQTAAAAAVATISNKKSLSHKPRILVLIGQGDTINPPTSAERVVQHLQQAGFPVVTLYHDGGHALPLRNDTCVAAIVDWIQQGTLYACLKE